MEKVHISFSDVMNLWFYDFQNIIDRYSNIVEQRKEEEDRQYKNQGYDPNDMNPKSMMKNAQSMMPKMPSINMPKI